MTKQDAAKTLMVRAAEYLEQHNMWLSSKDGIDRDNDRWQAMQIIRRLEETIETSSFEWCCLPWSKVVAMSHQILEKEN